MCALVDADGRRLARARLPEGVAGIARFHELIAAHLPEGDEPGAWWWSGSRPTAGRG